MVSLRYKYRDFYIGYVAEADESKIFEASAAQLAALSSPTDINGATVTWTNYAHVIRSFEQSPESTTIDVTTVNADVQRELPGRPRWTADMTIVQNDDVLEGIVNRAGTTLGALYIKRFGSTATELDTLVAVVGFGTATVSREDSGLQTVAFNLYNIGASLPQWRA